MKSNAPFDSETPCFKVDSLIISQLSDLQFLAKAEDAYRINYIKWLIMKYPNATVEVNPDIVSQQFKEFMEARYRKNVAKGPPDQNQT